MVQIIRDRFDAHDHEYLVFRVFEADDGQTRGYLLPRSFYDKTGALQVIKTDKNLTPEQGLPQALKLAEENGYKYLLVHDLDNLFPTADQNACGNPCSGGGVFWGDSAVCDTRLRVIDLSATVRSFQRPELSWS